MTKKTKIGIIICDRYRSCAGGKCFRALQNREGAFSIYSKDENVEVAGYTSCGGCPGGNIENAVNEMINNGVEIVHLATGFIVGYPPCPHIDYFYDFIKTNWNVKVIYGTHPIPQKYVENHEKLGTWNSEKWHDIIKPTFSDKKTRLAYN